MEKSPWLQEGVVGWDWKLLKRWLVLELLL
jgi:hypothetical protein